MVLFNSMGVRTEESMEGWCVVHDVSLRLELIENEFDRFYHQLRERKIRLLFLDYRYWEDFRENQSHEHRRLAKR